MVLSLLFRCFKKDVVQAWISIIGLAIGIVCFVLSSYWYLYETSFDNFHSDYDRIHYVCIQSKSGRFDWSSTPGAFAKSLSKYPEISSATSFENYNPEIKCYYKQDTLKALYYGVDSSFFSVFNLDFILGKPIKYSDANDIVISESFAHKLFGKESPLGKSIKLQIKGKSEKELVVCGIVKDYPVNSNLKFDILYHKDIESEDNWSWFVFYTFVKMAPGIDADSFIRKYEKDLNGEDNGEIRVVPLNDMHLDYKKVIPSISGGSSAAKMGLSRDVIMLFYASSILVILTSLCNFIMLQFTILMSKSKEITLRRIMGASFFCIYKLFLFRIFIYYLISFLLSLILTEVILPYMIDFVEIESDSILLWKVFLVLFFVIFVFLMLISLYPVCRLTFLKTQIGLRNNIKNRKGYFRNSMVLIQLIIASFILFFSIVIREQMNYAKKTDLGIEIDNIYTIILPNNLLNDTKNIIEDIRQNPYIELVTNFNSMRGVIRERMEKLELPNGGFCSVLEVNYDFQKLFNIQMKQGRFYSADLGDRGYDGNYLSMNGVSDVIILNEKAIKLLGVENPLGYSLGKFGTIIGVMKDYHSVSMREVIPPMAFLLNKNREERQAISIKVRPGFENKLDDFSKELFKKYDSSISYIPINSLKQSYLALYDSETKVMFLLDIICLISLLISALGIYSLALFAVNKCRKEVAIRKVLGASMKQIVLTLFKEYFLLALIANIVALPFAYYFSHQWLTGFAYHIIVHIGYFLVTFIFVLLIIVVTVMGQIWKVTNTSPVVVIKEND